MSQKLLHPQKYLNTVTGAVMTVGWGPISGPDTVHVLNMMLTHFR